MINTDSVIDILGVHQEVGGWSLSVEDTDEPHLLGEEGIVVVDEFKQPYIELATKFDEIPKANRIHECY